MSKRNQSKPRFTLHTSQAVFEDGAAHQVIVEARDGFAVLRLKGHKVSYWVPWGAVYHLARVRDADRELKER